MGASTETGAGAAGQTVLTIPNMSMDAATLQSISGHVFLAVAILLLLSGLYRIAPRVWKAIEDTLFSNWRLALLAATGLVLSLASGWTTWDGMRNFTNEPVLSLMITFGIQGVMLIIAWLIGESFATGMSQQAADSTRPGLSKGMQAGTGGLIGTLLFISLTLLFLQTSGQVELKSAADGSFDLWQMSDKLLIVAAGLLVAALVALYSASDIVKPYLQSSRVIIRNAVLWVMFLACMVTSVFFSFDSLFSAIFPQSERVRAAELRAQNQVSGIIADIGETIETRRMSATDELFRAEGWAVYDKTLDALATASRGAEGMIEAYYVQQIEQRRSAIAEQQERMATAEGSQSGLAIKKTTLTEELSRLEAERPALATDFAQKKSELDGRAREVDAKRVEAMAEDKGVEGTLKEGRGPIYRQRMGELGKLQDYYKIGEQRLKDSEKRVGEVNKKIDDIKRQLAEIDGSLAKLRGEADTAKQRIDAASTTAGDDQTVKIDPSRVLPRFETARVEFRQKPDSERLSVVQAQCTELLTAMASTPATKDRVTGIDCDPKRAVEAAAVLFTLNHGAKAFAATCAGGDKLAAQKSADQLFEFSRKCLSDSGLPSNETDQLRTKINFIELNRDDKAHRFVVTWNAFQDGNRLAYLALAIAIAIDSLIFMSGLFAANAVRSPLSDVPSHKARSAQQLEAIIENALLPDTFETARLTLQAMRPITNATGFMAEVRPERLDPHASERVIGVLNAGSTIQAVEFDSAGDRYLVRAELFEFLSVMAKKAFEANDQNVSLADLEKVVSVSLLPDVAANSETVLSYMSPISEKHGFMAEIKLGDVAEGHKRTVRSTLNAGAVHQRVQRAGDAGEHYFIHRDLYTTLARIRARSLYLGGDPQRPALKTAAYGGSISESRPQIEHRPDTASMAGRDAMAALSPPPLPSAADRAEVRQNLLSAMGRAAEDYDELVDHQVLPIVNIAASHLRRLSRKQPDLGKLIQLEMEALSSDLDQAANGLKHDKYSPAVVEAARQDLVEILPALLLQQNGRYKDVLLEYVTYLEDSDGQGNLDSRGRLLLKQLRNHEAALSKIARGDAKDWQRVANLLEDFGSRSIDEGHESERDSQTRRSN